MPIVQQTQTLVLDTTKLDQIIRESPGKIAEVVGKTATRILVQARVVTPRDPARPPIDPDAYKPSGELRANSNAEKTDDKGLNWEVWFNQVYAAAQELGNPAMNLPARPYLTPAVEANAQQFTDDLGKVLSEA